MFTAGALIVSDTVVVTVAEFEYCVEDVAGSCCALGCFLFCVAVVECGCGCFSSGVVLFIVLGKLH